MTESLFRVAEAVFHLEFYLQGIQAITSTVDTCCTQHGCPVAQQFSLLEAAKLNTDIAVV